MRHASPRTYRRVRDFLADAWYLTRRGRRLLRLLLGRSLDGKFRERLMLAVTEVNQCRFCSFAHTRAALQAGLGREEIDAILGGSFEGAPEAERMALAYAQHWAETEGRPDPEALGVLEETYGQDTADDIHLALRFIKAGNYSARSIEMLLHKLTFRRLAPAPGQPHLGRGFRPKPSPEEGT